MVLSRTNPQAASSTVYATIKRTPTSPSLRLAFQAATTSSWCLSTNSAKYDILFVDLSVIPGARCGRWWPTRSSYSCPNQKSPKVVDACDFRGLATI